MTNPVVLRFQMLRCISNSSRPESYHCLWLPVRTVQKLERERERAATHVPCFCSDMCSLLPVSEPRIDWPEWPSLSCNPATGLGEKECALGKHHKRALHHCTKAAKGSHRMKRKGGREDKRQTHERTVEPVSSALGRAVVQSVSFSPQCNMPAYLSQHLNPLASLAQLLASRSFLLLLAFALGLYGIRCHSQNNLILLLLFYVTG